MSWRDDVLSWRREAPPEHDAEGSDVDNDIDYAAPDPDVALWEFGNMLVDLKFTGKLPATTVCILAFWAHHAAKGGIVEQLARRPGQQTGKYSKHFDKVADCKLNESKEDFYTMSVPGVSRAQGTRQTIDLPVYLPYEAVDDEIRTVGQSNINDQLAKVIEEGGLPPRYYDHRVVRTTVDGTPVYPYTLYVDGIRFTRTDNVIAFWMCSMITFHRHLCVVVRKSELCNCGCRGWDTIYPIMLMLNHSFVALARGILPSARHDGQLEPPPLLIIFLAPSGHPPPLSLPPS